MPDKKKILFDALSQDEVYKDKVGTEEEFYAKLNDPAKAKMLYGALSQDEVYADKVGSEEEFYNKIGLKKKGSTTSQSSDGSSLSQDEIGKQLQAQLGGPQDFVVPDGFEAKQGKITPKKLKQSAQQNTYIKLSIAQDKADKDIQHSSTRLKKAQAKYEAANVKQAIAQRKIEDAKEAGDIQTANQLIEDHNRYIKEIEDAQAEAQDASNVYEKSANVIKKVNDYYIKSAKVEQARKDVRLKEEGGTALDLAKQFWNQTLPAVVKGSGVYTSAIGAGLDELSGNPTQYYTFGDLLQKAGASIAKSGEGMKSEVTSAANKSLFGEQGGYTDPRSYVNAVIGGSASMTTMMAMNRIGVPAPVTGTLMAADGIYEEAKAAGLSEKQALGFTATISPFVGALEAMGSNQYMKGITSKLFKEVAKDTVEKIAKKEITTELIVKTFGQTLKDKGLDYAKYVGENFLKEAASGVGETASQIVGETVFDATIGEGKKKGEGAFGRDITKPGFFTKAALDIVEGGIEEGVGGLLGIGLGYNNPGKLRLAKDILKAREGDNSPLDGCDLGLRMMEGKEISMEMSMRALRDFAVSGGGVVHGQTQIFILEGFEFRVVKGLITNFHQPKSTLLMLISAFVRGDWRRIYGFAMAKDYRFLSYGDGSLLWR